MPLFFNKHRAQRYRMPWGAAVGAVATYALNKSGGSDKNGGAGTTTNTKEPWLPAQGWITDNLASGQALQDKYAANPQSVQQQQAVNNIYGQSDYMRGLVPSLLGQLGQQQVGFDPSNPTAKPKAWSWDGLLGDGPNLNQGSMQSPALPAAAPAAAKPAGDFKDQGAISWNPWDPTSYTSGALAAQNTGGYGAFKYGDHPKPGTQAYADMNAYKNYGGSDPLGIYGWNPATSVGGPGNLGGNAGAATATGAPGTSADGTY